MSTPVMHSLTEEQRVHRVLHALRIRGLLGAPAVATATGLDDATAVALLDRLLDDGAVTFREGRMSGFALTPAGRELHARSLDAERDEAHEGELEAADAAFLLVNEPFKELCTQWQSSPPDTRRASIVPEMQSVHIGARDVVHHAARGLARFGVYAVRLDAALERFLHGDDDALLRPLDESYHDIWMELHHDLLLTLGRDRGVGDGH